MTKFEYIEVEKNNKFDNSWFVKGDKELERLHQMKRQADALEKIVVVLTKGWG